MSNSVWSHRQQPTRLCRPWDSPGKNTGVGCHFLLQCMKVKSESEVSQSCLTLSDPMGCSPPGSSVHGIFQVRVLEWVAICLLRLHSLPCSKISHFFILSAWLLLGNSGIQKANFAYYLRCHREKNIFMLYKYIHTCTHIYTSYFIFQII